MGASIGIYILDQETDNLELVESNGQSFSWSCSSWSELFVGVQRCLQDLHASLVSKRKEAQELWEHENRLYFRGHDSWHANQALKEFDLLARQVKDIAALKEWWRDPPGAEEGDDVWRFPSVHLMRRCLSEALDHEIYARGVEPMCFFELYRLSAVLCFLSVFDGDDKKAMVIIA